MIPRLWRGWLSVSLYFCFTGGVEAQTTAVLQGSVRDATDAVMVGVKVTARNLETGIARTAVTTEDGHFVLAGLRAGRYEVKGEMPGFRTLVETGIELTVGQNATLPLVLQIGEVGQQVNVVAQAPLVNTISPELSHLVSEGAIRELPLNGRNYTDLAFLQPGVVAYPHRDGGSVVAHGVGMSVNGQDPRANVYLIDGTPQNDFTNGPAGSAAGTALGMETIREFRVEVNSYSAEFGRSSGGQVNVLTKSGTNQFHGSAFYFLRNAEMDARNFFDPREKPPFKRNQFGGAFGGPVKRDKTFLFAGIESLHERLGRTILTLAPDDDARSGRLAPVNAAVKPYLDAYPLPTPGRAPVGGGIAESLFGFNTKLDEEFGQGRVDHNFSDRSQIFARYTFDGSSQRLPNDYPQFPRTFLSRNQFATVEHKQTVSASVLNTARVGFSRTRVGQDVEANLTAPLAPFIATRGLMGGIDIGGIPGRFGPQTSGNLRLTQNVLGFEDGVVWNKGRHLMKLGGMAEHYQDNMVNPTFSLGIYTFASVKDFVTNTPQRFLGLDPKGALDRYWRFTLFGLYWQDTYRVRNRLTISPGIRYETATMPVDLYGRDSTLLHLSDTMPTVGQLYQNPTRKNISPRFGFAWDPFGNGKTSFRGGYGLYFNTNNQQNLIVTVTNPPATPRISITNPTFPNPPFERGLGNTIRPVEWNLKNPYLHVWNVNVQRQVGADTLVTVGYAGSRGIHLLRNGDVNLVTPQRLADGTLFFPATGTRLNPAYTTIEQKRSDGNSWYNALLVEVRKRWNRDFNFQSSYTFARNIDTTQASTFFSDGTNDTTSAMPEYAGLNYNKGLADFHAKHTWVVNGTWAVPLARGLNGVKAKVLDGWEIGGISQIRSGSPLTLFVARNRSRSGWSPSLGPGLGPDRPSMAPGRSYESAVRGGPDSYFDPTAFVLQAAGTLGNMGRGALIGPGLGNLDVTAMKNWKWGRLGEQGNVQFRVEAFNLLNHANFGVPSLLAFTGAVDNEGPQSSLGRIRSTVTSSRQIQLGLRVSF